MVELNWLHDYAETWSQTWEIIGAFGSAAAAGAAVLLASRERADRKLAERDRDDARSGQKQAELTELRRQREAQARRVVVWTRREITIGADGGQERRTLTLGFGNYSDMPITDLLMVVAGSSTAIRTRSGEMLGLLTVLHPMESKEGSAPTVVADAEPTPAEIWVTFRDASGVRWRRHADGTLSQPPADPPFGP